MATAREIAERTAGPDADRVDRTGEFPAPAMAAVRAAGLLGALVPVELGGPGASVTEVGEAVTVLAEGCASTALIYAMHSIQVASVIRHGGPAMLERLTPGLIAGEMLLASANSEVGLWGDRRVSNCALEPIDGGYRLEKQASAVSYGADADVVLATARRTPESPPHDQVMAICMPPSLSLEPLGEWDALGLRGTRSEPFLLRCDVDPELVLDDYASVFLRTSLGVSVALLSSVWLGIAEAAARQAHTVVREQSRARRARADASPSISAIRLAELSVVLHQLREVVAGGLAHYDLVKDDEAVTSFAFASRMDNLKVASSTLAPEVVRRAMEICGMSGYRNDSPSSLGRLLRDVTGAPLMISNDRTLMAMAQLLPIRKTL